ncbi:MAG: FAD-dependent oxidoreductase [Methylobacillus sp.]|nr:FAD-dependent oxidoreductase [Methylobacillus sp.]
MTSDILIIGGGPVGATLALALKNYGLRVTVLEARHPGAGARDARTLALSEGSRLILSRLGVWSQLAPRATSINTIHISQRGRLGQTVLRAAEEGQEALGYVLPYADLSAALDDALVAAEDTRIEFGVRATALETSADKVTVTVEQHGATKQFSTRLAVIADGGRSMDALPGMKRETREYGHTALVGHVECALPHGNIAYERFTPQGPVALLPEGATGFALVWTAKPEEAERLMQLPEPQFLAELHGYFGDRVGEFHAITGRATFPLRLVTLRPVTAPRVVAIGNAAQTLHPVAGQGFNLGLRDAWQLALIARETAAELIGGADMLRCYQGKRRMDTGGGIFFTDFLVRVFSNDLPGWGMVRGAGLALLDMCAPARHFVSRKMSFGAKG